MAKTRKYLQMDAESEAKTNCNFIGLKHVK